MEDPSLPLPRFSPTKRKMRPDPIEVMAGIERVKVPLLLPICGFQHLACSLSEHHPEALTGKPWSD